VETIKIELVKNPKLMVIRWVDSHSPRETQWLQEWEVIEFLEERTFLAEAVGWLVHEDGEVLTLAAHRGIPNKGEETFDVFSAIIRIPRSSIVKALEVELGDTNPASW
jgi:hypothetical protein